METHALLAAMTKAVVRVELAGPAVRATNNLINGWAHLPVAVMPEPSIRKAVSGSTLLWCSTNR